MGISFKNRSGALKTVMIEATDVRQCINIARSAMQHGADAFGIEFSPMVKELRTEENIKSIFDVMGDKPIYFTNYRHRENENDSDEVLMEFQKQIITWGGTLADMPGDTFDEGAADQLTMNPEAIAKQLQFIKDVHALGGEVLISSHVMKYTTPERTLEIALEQEKRGADVVKIVTMSDTEEQLMKNLEATSLLRRELHTPFLFISSGNYGRLHRLLGPTFGGGLTLCVDNYDDNSTVAQPLLSSVAAVENALSGSISIARR